MTDVTLRSGLGAHLLAGRFDVSRDLFGRLMPGDRHDFELSSIRFDQGAISAHFRLSRIRALNRTGFAGGSNS
ncbi:MAG: hypothetical protein ACU0BZ_00285 [Paracoccus sp. (in: a-proteobacteria)]|uniref:hypothetical protein n=1 Tax=Paracoccus sp. TaxID=267 RepID=UPI0040592E3A